MVELVKGTKPWPNFVTPAELRKAMKTRVSKSVCAKMVCDLLFEDLTVSSGAIANFNGGLRLVFFRRGKTSSYAEYIWVSLKHKQP